MTAPDTPHASALPPEEQLVPPNAPSSPQSPVRRTPFSPAALLLAMACGLLCFLCLCVDLNADDFYYACFLQDGFDSFVEQNLTHYRTFNGRVLVHLLVQAVLYLGQPAYVLSCVGMLVLYPLLGRWAAGLGRDTRLTAPLVFLLLFLLIDVRILKESVFWISACFNYLFSALMAVCAGALCRFALRARLPWFLLLCPAAFLCGATTEQCGVFSSLLLLFLPLRAALRDRRLRLPCLLLPPFALAGYLTVLASPATQGRMAAEAGNSFWTQLSRLGGLLFREGCLSLLVLAVLGLVFLAAAALPDFPRIGFGALPCALLLAAVYRIPGLEDPDLWAFLLLLGFGGALSAALFSSPFYFYQGAFLAAGLGEGTIMALTASIAPRTMLPLALSLCLTGALLAAQLLSAVSARGRTAVLCALALLCTLVFLPTAAGFARNGRIRAYNVRHIEQARQTGVLCYCIDYDRDYCHAPMYTNGFYWNCFFTCYQLSDIQVYLVSSEMPPIYADGQRTVSPAYCQDGQVYFPAEQVLVTLGGRAEWTPEGTLFSLGEVEVLYYDDVLHAWDGEMWDTSEKQVRDYYTTCFTADIFRDCFGVSLTFDPQLRAYVAQAEAPAESDTAHP